MRKLKSLYIVLFISVCYQYLAIQLAYAQNKGKQYSFSFDSALNTRILKSYMGRYDIENSYGRILSVTIENNQLYAQITGQPKIMMNYSMPGEFYWKSIDSVVVKVKFIDNGQGIIDKLIFFLDTQMFNAKKMIDEAPVEVDPSIFARYVGTYDLAAFRVVFSREGDNLYSQALVPGGLKILLLPASDYEYFSLESSVRFKFSIGEDMNANSVIVNMNGQDIQGKRIKE
jgi:hypothetical protein